MGSLALSVLVFSSLVLFGEAQLEMRLEDEENYGIVFEGENVTMVCRSLAGGVEKVHFAVSLNDTFIIAGDIILPVGMERGVSDIAIAPDRIEFALTSVTRSSSGVYKCRTGTTEQNSMEDELDLFVRRNNEVLCRQNNTEMLISMESLRLSCYASGSTSDTFMWVRVANGTTSVVQSTTANIGNGVKTIIESVITPTDDPTPATYTCRSSNQFAENCSTGPHVVFSKPLLTFTPNITVLAPGETVIISCGSAIMPGAPAFWEVRGFSSGLTATTSESHLLNVMIPHNATPSASVSAFCSTFYLHTLLMRDLRILVREPSTTGPTGMPTVTEGMNVIRPGSQSDDEPGVTTVGVIVIGSLAVVVLIGILVAILFTVKICNSSATAERGRGPGNARGQSNDNRSKGSDTRTIDGDARASPLGNGGAGAPTASHRDVRAPPTPHGYDSPGGTSDDDQFHHYGRASPNTGYNSGSYELEMGGYAESGGGHSVGDGSVRNGGYDHEFDQDEDGQSPRVNRSMSVSYSQVNKGIGDTDYY